MDMAHSHSAADFCEIILCCENNSWLFSTYAQAFQIEDALDKAEDEFLIHTALHDIRLPKATSAYVLTDIGKHFFSKRDGKWQTAGAAAMPLVVPSEKVIAFPPGARLLDFARGAAH
jgi:hypothetical protein